MFFGKTSRKLTFDIEWFCVLAHPDFVNVPQVGQSFNQRVVILHSSVLYVGLAEKVLTP